MLPGLLVGLSPAGPEPLGSEPEAAGTTPRRSPEQRGCLVGWGLPRQSAHFSHWGPASASGSLPSWKLDHWTLKMSNLLWPGVCASHLTAEAAQGLSFGGTWGWGPGPGPSPGPVLVPTPRAAAHRLQRASLGCVCPVQMFPVSIHHVMGSSQGPAPIHPSIHPNLALDSAFTCDKRILVQSLGELDTCSPRCLLGSICRLRRL